MGFPGGAMVKKTKQNKTKNCLLMQKTWVWSLVWGDPLGEGTATHYSILAWRILWTGEPGELLSMRMQRARHDLAYTHKGDKERTWSLIWERNVLGISLGILALPWVAFPCLSFCVLVCKIRAHWAAVWIRLSVSCKAVHDYIWHLLGTYKYLFLSL